MAERSRRNSFTCGSPASHSHSHIPARVPSPPSVLQTGVGSGSGLRPSKRQQWWWVRVFKGPVILPNDSLADAFTVGYHLHYN